MDLIKGCGKIKKLARKLKRQSKVDNPWAVATSALKGKKKKSKVKKSEGESL